jgi:NADPH:quinone reductase
MPLPQEMNAVTIDRFGSLDVLKFSRRQVPKVGAGEVLIQVAYAGVGAWDPLEREGGFVDLIGEPPTFPHTLGADGSGRIAAVGAGVERFHEGDLVYAIGGGFYAEYVALNADTVSLLPDGIALDQAGAMPIVALTALYGLDDILHVARGEALLIYGASGDLGHIAVQIAKRMGARVLAVASGDDGSAMVRDLGADVVIDGKTADIGAAVRDFAPAGIDAVLALAGGVGLDAAIAALRENGRAAYPLGVEPEPEQRADIHLQRYDITLDTPAITKLKMVKLNETIGSAPFSVKIAQIFPLNQAMAAQRALGEHRVGKIVLQTAP